MLLRVRVYSAQGDTVKVNLPLSLVKMGIETGLPFPKESSLSPLHDVDWDSVLRMVESGVVGKLVEVDSAAGDHVEIVIE